MTTPTDSERSPVTAQSDGYQPATDRNLIAEKRARMDRAAAGGARRTGRKSGDPRADRARAAGRSARS